MQCLFRHISCTSQQNPGDLSSLGITLCLVLCDCQSDSWKGLDCSPFHSLLIPHHKSSGRATAEWHQRLLPSQGPRVLFRQNLMPRMVLWKGVEPCTLTQHGGILLLGYYSPDSARYLSTCWTLNMWGVLLNSVELCTYIRHMFKFLAELRPKQYFSTTGYSSFKFKNEKKKWSVKFIKETVKYKVYFAIDQCINLVQCLSVKQRDC